jgi:hypothetical protein
VVLVPCVWLVGAAAGVWANAGELANAAIETESRRVRVHANMENSERRVAPE